MFFDVIAGNQYYLEGLLDNILGKLVKSFHIFLISEFVPVYSFCFV